MAVLNRFYDLHNIVLKWNPEGMINKNQITEERNVSKLLLRKKIRKCLKFQEATSKTIKDTNLTIISINTKSKIGYKKGRIR